MYLLAINQALPYGCSFVTYGYPEGSAAGDITIIWNDVFKWSVDCAHPFLSFIYFLLPFREYNLIDICDVRNIAQSKNKVKTSYVFGPDHQII